MRHKNKLNLGLDLPRSKSTTPSTQDAQIPGALGNNLTEHPGTLEIGVEFKLDLRNEDLVVLKELGAGNGGTVSKVMHSATKVIMAKKVFWGRAVKNEGRMIAHSLPRSYTWKQRKTSESRSFVRCISCMTAPRPIS